MQIRPMREEDLDAVMRIERSCFAPPWKREDFAAHLQADYARLFVAEREADLIGYVDLLSAADQGDIANIAVREDARGGGVGSALLLAALNAARELGLVEIFLEVRTSNEAAIRMYERASFSQIGTRRAYYTQPTEDACLMRLTL